MAGPIPDPLSGEVLLRNVTEEDLPIFFEHQRDPDATRMAAFPSRDRDAFMAHWAKILVDQTVVVKTVLFNGQVAGNVVCFGQAGLRNVGYWMGKDYWGKGIATRALAAFLELVRERPLYAHAAKRNAGSIRVLEKCGFAISGEDIGFPDEYGQEVEEFILRLD